MFFRLIISVLMLGFLSGCVTASFETDLSKLSKTQDMKPIVLKENFAAVVDYGLAKTQLTFQLNAGVYFPEYEDHNGVYYRAPDRGVLNGVIPEKFPELGLPAWNGGIWVAKCSNNSKPNIDIYFYPSDGSISSGSLKSSVYEMSALDLVNTPVVNHQTIQSGVGGVIGLGIVDLIINTNKNKMLIASLGFASMAKKEQAQLLESLIFSQLEPCNRL